MATKQPWDFTIYSGSNIRLANNYGAVRKYNVYVSAKLDREPDRELFADLTPEQADMLARQLQTAAHKARQLTRQAARDAVRRELNNA